MTRGPRAFTAALLHLFVLTCANATEPSTDRAPDAFGIHVVDDATGRGVPLVQLKTTNEIRFYTDSAGYVAFREPGLLNHKVHFTISTPGYEFPADGFGVRGVTLDAKPGGGATIKLKRTSIAERLYRVTGEGIYADSVLLGITPPIERPLLNCGVLGQDSVFAELYRGKIYWFWGDTNRADYPLGNFSTTGAVSDLPGAGGLDPNVGVNLHYFCDEHAGFIKKMVPIEGPGPVWIDGVMVVNDDSGRERMLAHFSRMKDLGARLERGLIAWNDDADHFDKLAPVPLDAPLAPAGHALRIRSSEDDYFYFAAPYPSIRVAAQSKSVTDLASYEGYTPLVEGARFAGKDTKLQRDSSGNVVFAWKRNTPPLDVGQHDELVKQGLIRREDSPWRLRDAAGGKPIRLHGGSVYWNEFRKRYVMIGLEAGGSSSNIGEVWYAESKQPEGPWNAAVKIVTHDKMDFYNPTQHPFFDQQGGRIIYFEGTYTNTFSGNPTPTPRYDYNQVMYRLDLSDPRLKPAQQD